MKQFEVIYEANKELDKLFANDYDFKDKDIFIKNILELLVELGELANETRCFKYWSKKGPSSKDVILDEYADCVLMALAFAADLNVSLDEPFEKPVSRAINEQFIYLYQVCSILGNNYNKETIKNILTNLIYLGELLKFSEQDIIEGCLNKINRNKKRLEKFFVD